MILKEVFEKTVGFFRQKGIESPRLESELLLSHALNFKNRMEIYLKFEAPLSDEEVSRCRAIVARKSTGEPTAYILGERGFYAHQFVVGPGVLIPRPETELLIEKSLEWLKQRNLSGELKILDLGTGSGCIGLSMLKALPNARAVLVEKSSEAVAIAKKNAENLGVIDRCEWFEKSALDVDFSVATFDVILSNPPYIAEDDSRVETNVRKYEPLSALFAGQNGEEALKTWSQKFAPSLKKPGLMIFEMGDLQGPTMQTWFEGLGFDRTVILKDLSGKDRAVLGEWSNETQRNFLTT